jgi:hypothetical protein
MLRDIVTVRPMKGYRLWLRFEDGVEGEIDITKMVRFEGIFAPLKQRDFFLQVKVEPELGTICWPNGADLDPDVLYSEVSQQPLPLFEDIPLRRR